MRKWLNIARVVLLPKLCTRCYKIVQEALLDVASQRQEYRQLFRQIRRQRAVAPRAVDDLLNEPLEAQLERVRGCYSKYRTRPVAEEILRRAMNAIHGSPEESLRLANLAFEVAERILGMHNLAGGLVGVADLKARAEAQMGNACRVLHRKAEAADHFQQAISHLFQGSGDGVIYAEVFSLYGSYLKAIREYSKALEFLGKAERLYEEAGKTHFQGKAMLTRAAILEDLLAQADAVALAQEALTLLDHTAAPELAGFAFHNLAFSFCELGQFEKAEKALKRSDELAQRSFDSPRPRFLLARTWTLAKLASGQGDIPRAAELFRQALAGFQELRDSFRTALVSFDLASLYATENRFDELALVAEDTYQLLLEQDLQPQAARVLEIFIEAARRRQIALEIIRTTAACVRRYWPCQMDCS